MSNAFPSMISNEPPPLDQSDDDEDSEEYRDFTAGLKLDVDPSPMSTPQKGAKPSPPPSVSNRIETPSPEKIIPTNGIEPEPVFSPLSVPNSNHVERLQENSHSNHNSILPPLNSSMKTSYIGTMEPDPEYKEADDPVGKIDKDPFASFARSEVVIEPVNGSKEAHARSDTSPSLSDDDDFDDFQEFQATVPVSNGFTEEHSPALEEVVHCEVEVQAEENKEDVNGSVSMETTDVSKEEVAIPCPSEELKFEDASSFEQPAEAVPTITESDIFEDAVHLPTTPSVPATSSSEIVVTESAEKEIEFQANFGGVVGEDEDDDFDNFQDFKSSSVQPLSSDTTSTDNICNALLSATTTHVQEDSNGNICENSEITSATEESASEMPTLEPSQSTSRKPEPQLEHSSSSFNSFSDGEDEDFDDFQAFQSTSKPPPSAPETVPSEDPFSNSPELLFPNPFGLGAEALGEHKFEPLLKSLFVANADTSASVSCIPIDKELKESSGDEHWNQVEDFEGSQGLLFKWLNSVAYQRFLQSLKIDKSTIVYSDKWGAIEVPRFAASLVDSPLQPETGSKAAGNDLLHSKEVSPTRYTGSEQTTSADHESTNLGSKQHPASSSKVNGTTSSAVSLEAERILNRLPDLSYMRAKNLVFPNNNNNAASRVISSDV